MQCTERIFTEMKLSIRAYAHTQFVRLNKTIISVSARVLSILFLILQMYYGNSRAEQQHTKRTHHNEKRYAALCFVYLINAEYLRPKKKHDSTQSQCQNPRPNLPEYEIGDICASVN